ncbi:MAG: hypothetical protein QOJ79_1027 [Actinomycetota bacterium]|jgi:hypothetical protein|nr:hypothetical protein [Actinomycetota bacterium]
MRGIVATCTAAVLMATAACGTSASKADNDALCSALSRELTGAGLAGTPTRAQAVATANRLDAHVRQVADSRLHDAVVRLHQDLHDIDVAWRRRGPADVTRAAERARADARRAARACGLGSDAFLTS